MALLQWQKPTLLRNQFPFHFPHDIVDQEAKFKVGFLEI